jgi:hypothetical protein
MFVSNELRSVKTEMKSSVDHGTQGNAMPSLERTVDDLIKLSNDRFRYFESMIHSFSPPQITNANVPPIIQEGRVRAGVLFIDYRCED